MSACPEHTPLSIAPIRSAAHTLPDPHPPFAPTHFGSCSQRHASDFQPSYRVADLFVKRAKLLLRLQYVLPRVNCQGPQLQQLFSSSLTVA